MPLSCKQVTEKLSENLDQPLKGRMWLGVKFHLLICRLCRLYRKQIKIVSSTIGYIESERTASPAVRKNVEKSYRELHGKKNSSE